MVNRAESLRQARSFDLLNARYIAAGLCPRCAAQAAFGHQIGFHSVYPPCPDCEGVVQAFQTPRCNGWKSLAPKPRQRKLRTASRERGTGRGEH